MFLAHSVHGHYDYDVKITRLYHFVAMFALHTETLIMLLLRSYFV